MPNVEPSMPPTVPRRTVIEAVESGLGRFAIDRGEAVRLVRAVTEQPGSVAPIAELKESILRDGVPDAGEFERWLLLNAAVDALEALPDTPIPPSVRSLVYREVDFLLDATPQAFKGYHVGRSGFFEMCRKMSLQRF